MLVVAFDAHSSIRKIYQFRKLLVCRGVVQLFNAVAERQKELGKESANILGKKRCSHNVSTESFKKKLMESRTIKVPSFSYFLQKYKSSVKVKNMHIDQVFVDFHANKTQDEDDKKEDWLFDDQIAIKSETEDDLDTSGIKTEPESDDSD